MGSKVNPDIRLMGNCPSLNASKMMPALDVQIWVVCGQLKYQHYRKLMANTMVMMKCSAHPEKTKRTSLAQEGKRILKNTRQYLPWQVSANHLNDLSKRMKASGYKEQFRMEVIKSAVEGFGKLVEADKLGGRPVKRPGSWQADLRQQQKHRKRKTWFSGCGHHVPLFVPRASGSELGKRRRKITNQDREIRFIIVKLGGTKIHHLSWKPTPWAGQKCGSQDCFDRGATEGRTSGIRV